MITYDGDSFYGNCTLGFVARRNDTLGFVSDSHCTTSFFGIGQSLGDWVHQLATRVVAREAVDPDGYICGILLFECRASDAAFFSQYQTQPMTVGLILRTQAPTADGWSAGQGSIAVNSTHPYFFVTREENEDVYTGQEVHKIGAYGGWTSGEITGTCVDYTPAYPQEIRCMYKATYWSTGGDSGGPG